MYVDDGAQFAANSPMLAFENAAVDAAYLYQHKLATRNKLISSKKCF